MLSLATNERQTILFYNSDRKNHKEVRAYLESSKQDLLPIDISKTKVAAGTWLDIADFTNVTVKELVDHNHPDYKTHYGDQVLTDDETIDALKKEPSILTYPIAVKGDQVSIINEYGKSLNFHEPDSIGVKKTTVGKENKH